MAPTDRFTVKNYHRRAEADIFDPSRAGDSVASAAFPDLVLEVTNILG